MSKKSFAGTATQPQCNRKFCQFNKDQYCMLFLLPSRFQECIPKLCPFGYEHYNNSKYLTDQIMAKLFEQQKQQLASNIQTFFLKSTQNKSELYLQKEVELLGTTST